MSQESIVVEVKSRTNGKHYSRALRREKYVPGVVYGPKTENLDLAIEEKHLVKFRGHGYENVIFKLKSEDAKLNGLAVLMKDLQIHAGSQRPFHVDFYAPDMSRDVRVDIEMRLVGKAKGLADGGFTQQVLRHITVDCLPLNIPEFIEVDVTELELNSSLHVSDVKFPEGVSPVTSADSTVVTCTMAAEEEVATPAATAAATPAAAPAPAAAAPAAKK